MTISQNANMFSAAPRLLFSESAEKFAELLERVTEEIKPNGDIEMSYVRDIADILWETMRYRRFKADILNTAFQDALQTVLKQLLPKDDYEFPFQRQNDAESMADDWFATKKTKRQVSRLLRKHQMDEGAIEAQAFRSCADDIERLHRLLTTLQFRRDKLLVNIAHHKTILSKHFKECSDRHLEEDQYPRLMAVGETSD